MNKIRQSKENSMPLGLHEGLVLLKDLPKPSMPNRTYMSENHFEKGFQCLFGLTQRVSAIERLIQTFDAK
jgi:hypothetical protein